MNVLSTTLIDTCSPYQYCQGKEVMKQTLLLACITISWITAILLTLVGSGIFMGSAIA
jgi:hypothetical protein